MKRRDLLKGTTAFAGVACSASIIPLGAAIAALPTQTAKPVAVRRFYVDSSQSYLGNGESWASAASSYLDLKDLKPGDVVIVAPDHVEEAPKVQFRFVQFDPGEDGCLNITLGSNGSINATK